MTSVTNCENFGLKEELYFLICKFLEDSPCKNGLQALKEECSRYKLFPSRLDWQGTAHHSTFENSNKLYPNISNQYLFDICKRLYEVQEEIRPSHIPGCPSILCGGNRSILRRSEDANKQVWRYCRYFSLLKKLPIPPPVNLNNEIRSLPWSFQRQQVLGRTAIRRADVYRRLTLRNRILGHSATIYSLCFDRRGEVIFSGADDHLVKCWSVRRLALLRTFRGHQGEICDLSVSYDNKLLASGACDKRVLIWDLRDGSQVACLSGHVSAIACVAFSPLCRDAKIRWLASSAKDGNVCFWSYHLVSPDEPNGVVEFKTTPSKFNERSRPGAFVLCLAFSRGGLFMACGSCDQAIRVYSFQAGLPTKICELEGHKGEVDSLQFAHTGTRFATGCTDGTCRIWWFERQHWHSRVLDLRAAAAETAIEVRPSSEPLQTRMVCWTGDDRCMITAGSNFLVLVWCASSGNLLRVFQEHSADVFVLDSSTLNGDVVLSAGYDARLTVYDIASGQVLTRWRNVNSQTTEVVPPPLHDCRFSPDGRTIAAVDWAGHILVLGLCPEKGDSAAPQQQFFHSDSSPITFDAQGMVLDTTTGRYPHLLPPPYLVNLLGDPLPAEQQRRVPGREHMDEISLRPVFVADNRGDFQVVDDLLADPDTRPLFAHIEDVQVGGLGAAPPRVEGKCYLHSSVWGSNGRWLCNEMPKEVSKDSVNVGDEELRTFLRESRLRGESVAEKSSELGGLLTKGNGRRHATSIASTIVAPAGTISGAVVNILPRTGNRLTKRAIYDTEPESNNDEPDFEQMLSEATSSSSDESEYSDWQDGDNSQQLAAPTRRRQTQRRAAAVGVVPPTIKNVSKAPVAAPAAAAAASTSANQKPLSVRLRARGVLPGLAASAATSPTSPAIDIKNDDLAYLPPRWLTSTLPLPSPYVAQIGDIVMYCREGHAHYLDVAAVNERGPWRQWPNLRAHEPCRVMGLRYELRHGHRLCSVKLALLDDCGRSTGQNFRVKYRDMDNVLDFLVLKSAFDKAKSRNWPVGTPFRSIIDACWYGGKVIGPGSSSEFDGSLWTCLRVRWDTNEEEDMSPWDLLPLELDDSDKEKKNEEMVVACGTGIGRAATVAELACLLPHTLCKDEIEAWPCGGGAGRDSTCDLLADCLDVLMKLSCSREFRKPVDLSKYPLYARLIAYPIDLATMRDRLRNRYYRRQVAFLYDTRYIANNAEFFNEPASRIVRDANLVAGLCSRIISKLHENDGVAKPNTDTFVRQLYAAMQIDLSSASDVASDAYDEKESQPQSENEKNSNKLMSEEDSQNEAADSCEEEAESSDNKAEESCVDASDQEVEETVQGGVDLADETTLEKDDRSQWQSHCGDVLANLLAREESRDFREPVDTAVYVDYLEVVPSPLDLNEVRRRLLANYYNTPVEFARDVQHIFNNSRIYNTDRNSKIYAATGVLAHFFETRLRDAIRTWKRQKRRLERRAERRKQALARRFYRQERQVQRLPTDSGSPHVCIYPSVAVDEELSRLQLSGMNVIGGRSQPRRAAAARVAYVENSCSSDDELELQEGGGGGKTRSPPPQQTSRQQLSNTRNRREQEPAQDNEEEEHAQSTSASSSNSASSSAHSSEKLRVRRKFVVKRRRSTSLESQRTSLSEEKRPLRRLKDSYAKRPRRQLRAPRHPGYRELSSSDSSYFDEDGSGEAENCGKTKHNLNHVNSRRDIRTRNKTFLV